MQVPPSHNNSPLYNLFNNHQNHDPSSITTEQREQRLASTLRLPTETEHAGYDTGYGLTNKEAQTPISPTSPLANQGGNQGVNQQGHQSRFGHLSRGFGTGILNRNTKPNNVNGQVVQDGTNAHIGGIQGNDAHIGGGRKRGFFHDFSAIRWLRLHAFDLLTMAAMGAIGLGVYEANPAPTRNFPVFNTDGSIAYPEFAYPLRKNIIPIWLAAFLAFFVPLVFFLLFQIRIRSFDMLLGTVMGLLESLITAAVFQVFHKWLIGGLRPHFLDVCKPDVTQIAFTGSGFKNIMYDRSICTGDQQEINDSLESWMSGHSTAAFAGFVYLFFFFNAQLKVMSDHRPAYWKMILLIFPLLFASLIAASLTVDEYHNWYDCLGGAITGTLCAFVAYRKNFAAIWDFRFNHILLPRTKSFFHMKPRSHQREHLRFGYTPAESLTYAPPTTKEGGWGGEHGNLGAPGDATVLNV